MTPNKFDIARYRKFIVAAIGGIIATLTLVYGPDQPLIQAIISAATALGVYAAPNAQG